MTIFLLICVIEHSVILFRMRVNAHNQPDTDVHTEHRRTTCTHKWQRNADNRHNSKDHSDIHQTVGKHHSEHANTDISAKAVLCDAAVGNDLQADIRQHRYQRHRTDKSAGLTNI